ncbi:MAG: tRNA uridine-5-carboxymethylaminomethyl(34) synthesis enzyme MnmG [Halanaerobium sp.]|nr:tRNA uridine-5-carboxymethylaminomethyl(34) synthesis enzyme MnmG [Halanaerobium sp.]
MYEYPKEYDVIVIGAGHAGCEAAFAPARMGYNTLVLTINLDHVAFMPCNPSIGGPAKSHVVREIDALGGEMGRNIDEAMIQVRMLNTRKGPAVHALRAQADKRAYHIRMKQKLEQEPLVDLKQGIVREICLDGDEVTGVITETGIMYRGKKVIMTTGTFLKGRVIIGEASFNSGPNQQFPANNLSANLEELGIKLRRFKTGTPPRVARSSINFARLSIQEGAEEGLHFSFNGKGKENRTPCWLAFTNSRTHQVIRDNIPRAPLFSGDIEGTGPRYCPSIEDKVIRFPDKERHQIFVEPEGLDTDEMYLSGLSTSLPADVQLAYLRTIEGFEEIEIMRPGYAIEYDCLDPQELKLSLESKKIKGLYSAGQVNGTSGYEEAAGQGLLAGINAGLSIQGKEPLLLKRSEAYIGVLIDDLVTKGTHEPYRLLTSRAEYRLILRQDNADLRLTPIGYRVGLISEERYQKLQAKKEEIARAREFLEETQVTPTDEVVSKLEELGSGSLSKPVSLATLLQRPELGYGDLRYFVPELPELKADVREEVEIQIKYDGYIDRQLQQVERFRKFEEKKIPEDIDYQKLDNLRKEAREKLEKVKPLSLGQASRISGVSPADISVLMIYLEQRQREGNQ